MEAMHVVLKYNDSLYSVDTIEEHINVIKKKGKVIWGIIKPNENSPGIGRDKIKTINDQIQNGIEIKAFFYNQGHIRGIGLISRFWDRDEMRNGQYIEFIPEYYRSDINKCVGGIELREITKIDDDSFERENLYQHDRTERINFGNQVNPMYVFEKEPRSYFSKKGSDIIEDIEVKEDMENTYNTIKDEITNIKNYIRSSGFLYDDNLIENYYLSLKTKPFLILAGISGTGKSKLARLFAEAIGATAENGRFKLVPVRPDWSDSTDLLGYKDLNGRFHPGVLTTFVKDAMENPQKPYFFVLDEMNLARVEYYFSDVLSIIESRNKVNKTIVTDRLLNRELLDKDSFSEYGDIYIPDNLYFIGTVNMDETTFPFSKKVLDRANVIELSDVDLDYAFEDVEEVSPKTLNNAFLRSDFLMLKDCAGYDDIVDDTISILKNINVVLGYYRFGYRVRDEICFYTIYNSMHGLMDFDDAMDYEILQKILPRINGSSISIKKILIELFKICSGNLENRFDYDSDVSEKMFEEIANAKYRKSCEKIAFMTRRYEEDGFTSYWL
ncbi:ATPase associated with various cellular activities AAA_5 [Thermoanaerobacterium xylanolyticum LX-11]|uniref:ATPase associated with various cellular activities AAA_5 n=2 Tax=Thermoanaerobacterium xylanolyticum TaxID=29329 RepID=F6BJV6_THEXL|nr:ATPase associated with various cellular activities AAA_5 [Thermoanaerobacterium xylanolyticum LX-11]